MWYRMGNDWIFQPVPNVKVAVWNGKWHAFVGNMLLKAVQPSVNSDRVKRAVWEYFDNRVNL